jgi:hypothetical protein
MLRSPRRLPQRYNRTVTPATRRLVQSRHKRHRQYVWQRWQREFARLERKFLSMRHLFVRFLALIVAGLVCLMIGLAIFSPILEIREIKVQRTDPRIDIGQIQQSLSTLFGEHLFFLSSQEVETILREAVPDLADAEIRKEYPSTLTVRLTLVPLMAKLVIEEPDQSADAPLQASGSGEIVGSHFLTTEGMYVVYSDAQVATGSGLSSIRIVDWGVRPAPWTQLLQPDLILLMRKAEEEISREFGLSVQSRVVYVRAREFHLKTPLYTLWFDVRSPLEEQLQRYRLFLETVPAGTAKEYVDLRLTGKIVYK